MEEKEFPFVQTPFLGDSRRTGFECFFAVVAVAADELLRLLHTTHYSLFCSSMNESLEAVLLVQNGQFRVKFVA